MGEDRPGDGPAREQVHARRGGLGELGAGRDHRPRSGARALPARADLLGARRAAGAAARLRGRGQAPRARRGGHRPAREDAHGAQGRPARAHQGGAREHLADLRHLPRGARRHRRGADLRHRARARRRDRLGRRRAPPALARRPAGDHRGAAGAARRQADLHRRRAPPLRLRAGLPPAGGGARGGRAGRRPPLRPHVPLPHERSGADPLPDPPAGVRPEGLLDRARGGGARALLHGGGAAGGPPAAHRTGLGHLQARRALQPVHRVPDGDRRGPAGPGADAARRGGPRRRRAAAEPDAPRARRERAPRGGAPARARPLAAARRRTRRTSPTCATPARR